MGGSKASPGVNLRGPTPCPRTLTEQRQVCEDGHGLRHQGAGPSPDVISEVKAKGHPSSVVSGLLWHSWRVIKPFCTAFFVDSCFCQIADTSNHEGLSLSSRHIITQPSLTN